VLPAEGERAPAITGGRPAVGAGIARAYLTWQIVLAALGEGECCEQGAEGGVATRVLSGFLVALWRCCARCAAGFVHGASCDYRACSAVRGSCIVLGILYSTLTDTPRPQVFPLCHRRRTTSPRSSSSVGWVLCFFLSFVLLFRFYANRLFVAHLDSGCLDCARL
jgi:hypothetical protein